MGDFKDTTKTVAGHHHVPASQFHTFGNQSLPPARPVKPTAHKEYRDLTERDPSHDFSGSAAVRRQVPTTELEGEHGGRSDLLPGYAKGGRHFHVHKHYYSGGKVKHSESKHYAVGGATRKMNMQNESEFRGNPGRRGGFATGGTINKLAHGGECETGGTRNKLRKGGMHINPAHKGKFTEEMTGSKKGHLTGKDVQRGLHSGSAATRKRANFARMARRGFKPLAKGGPTTKHAHHEGKQAGAGHVHRNLAKGGWLGGSGHIHDHTEPVAPDYATGGTINKLGAGGALYKRGGESKHERSREHKGFRGELSMLKHRLKG